MTLEFFYKETIRDHAFADVGKIYGVRCVLGYRFAMTGVIEVC